MKQILVGLIATAVFMAPVQLQAEAAGTFFNDDASIDDTSQAVFVPGMRYCVHPSRGVCQYWIEGRTSRPDWDHAMFACLRAGFSPRICDEAVNQDGEF